MSTIREIFRLFAERGGEAYFGEPVSQLEHALQTAWQAEQAGAPESLVAAALLHDVGHLIHQMPEDIADRGIDVRHEVIGAIWLARYFPESVSEPARLHVAAKRYLCAVDENYRQQLSPSSMQSLELQGGVMSEDEIGEFVVQPFALEAVQLRQWDEGAKVAGADIPDLQWYRSRLENMLNKPL